MADIVTFLLGILTFPLALGRAVLKKFGKLAKNTFLSGVKWYRIGQKTEEMERAVRRRAARERGEDVYEAEASWVFDQNRGAGPADLYGHLSSGPEGPDTDSPSPAGYAGRQVSDQRLENQELEAAIENSDDPEMLEQVAREKGHVKQDEIVYIDVAN